MRISWQVIIAPWIGAAAAWLAAHGLALTPIQTAELVTLAAGACANVAHVIEQLVRGKVKPLPPPAPAASRASSSSSSPSKPLAVIFCLIFAGALTATLSGCAGSGSLVQSPDEAIYAGFGAYVAAEQGVTQAVLTGSMSAAEAQKLNVSLQVAYAALQAARAAEQSSPATSSQKLTEAVAAINAIEAVLQADIQATHKPGAGP